MIIIFLTKAEKYIHFQGLGSLKLYYFSHSEIVVCSSNPGTSMPVLVLGGNNGMGLVSDKGLL